MQLAHNPITKILNEKLKSFDFNNLEYLMCQKERVNQFQYKLKDLVVDLTRQPLNQEIKNELIKLARVSNIQQKIQNMVSGQKINISENRSVGHFGLRNPNRFKSNEWLKLSKFTNKVLAEKKINHIINVGIGGSDLGPLMVNKALKPFATDLKISYASNVDPSNMSDILENCDPLKTLFIITSKSFGTLDTLKNAQIGKNWLLNAGISIEESMVAITSSPKKAIAWGFEEKNVYEFSASIGGRYSLWSSVGMSIILSIGEKHFKDFLLHDKIMSILYLLNYLSI